MRKIKTFDLIIVLIPLILTTISVATIYSLFAQTGNDSIWLKQLIYTLVGFVVLFFTFYIDYRFFRSTVWIFYFIALLLLIAVNLFGHTAGGAARWLDLKIFPLQPSEVAKISIIFFLSTYFSDKIGQIQLKHILLSLLLILPIFLLILSQPDLGSAMVILFIYFVLLFLAKPTKRQKLFIFSAVALMFLTFFLSYKNIAPFKYLLHDYQRHRVAVFFNPDLDPYGRGYNTRQARITIGSGGIIGRGLGKGTQSQLHFLPEAHTDFIFSGVAESFGFLGTFVILSLYLFLLLRIGEVASCAQDNFGMFLAIGILAMFAFQIFVNTGMNISLLPVTGIPLPFLSYGGTSLLVSLFAIGLVQSIFMRHKKISF